MSHLQQQQQQNQTQSKQILKKLPSMEHMIP